ncbi:hypothetical protein HMH01_14595 [Halovulum dunhuangense]|uniref:Uncharacterized protein n=1 Tax=Halovulum dunhuangense TaxID=1505036 RepID=A0A849L6F9_9RHOB|nr:M10 family metallopeptidase C-terminal domain-containing protein [Halovulum dunhuangense]NNU81667.1 hypothetical protein [Halovulum dunhuangense]
MSGIIQTGRVLFGDADNPLDGISDVEWIETGTGLYLAVASESHGAVSVFALDDATGPTLVARLNLSPTSGTFVLSDLVPAPLSTGMQLVTLGRYDDSYGVYSFGDDGALTPTGVPLSGPLVTGGHVGATHEINGRTLLYSANIGATGLEVFDVLQGGGLAHLQTFVDINARPIADVTALHPANLHGSDWLFAASAFDQGIGSMGLNWRGRPWFIERFHPQEDQGFARVTEIDSLQIGDRAFVVVAASQTDSLSVLRLSVHGRMKMVDHLIDTLATRFEDVQAMEAFQTADRSFVIAAGADDGVSLFELTWNGRLVHLETLADGFDTTLRNPSSLAVRVVGDTARVQVGSASEHGVTELILDLSRSGSEIWGGPVPDQLVGTPRDDVLWGLGRSDQLFGDEGDDRLIDGRGRDMLHGGLGEDTFVLIKDGRTDRIADFEPGIDRIDLSDFAYVNHMDDLLIASRLWGAVIFVDDERIRLHHPDAVPYDVTDLTADSFIFG